VEEKLNGSERAGPTFDKDIRTFVDGKIFNDFCLKGTNSKRKHKRKRKNKHKHKNKNKHKHKNKNKKQAQAQAQAQAQKKAQVQEQAQAQAQAQEQAQAQAQAQANQCMYTIYQGIDNVYISIYKYIMFTYQFISIVLN
jgi:hypothetical protein